MKILLHFYKEFWKIAQKLHSMLELRYSIAFKSQGILI